MDREEFVRRLVLDKICDDYENLDQTILHEVSEDGAKCGLTIGRHEVVGALAALVSQGLAKAYALSATHPLAEELADMPRLGPAGRDCSTYFYATEKGIALQLSDSTWWPSADDTNDAGSPC